MRARLDCNRDSTVAELANLPADAWSISCYKKV